MQVIRIDKTTNLTYSPKQVKPSFGFCPTREQGNVFRYLREKAPDYVKKFNQQIDHWSGDSRFLSFLRDALMYKALFVGHMLKALESVRHAFVTKFPIFGA